MPGGDKIELLLRHAQPARHVKVDLQAESAVVDLRDTQLRQFDDSFVEARLLGALAHGEQCGLRAGRRLLEGLVGDADVGHGVLQEYSNSDIMRRVNRASRVFCYRW
jgi:hypothetical protein